MAVQSKLIYLTSKPVATGVKTPRTFATIVRQIFGFGVALIPADTLTVIASFAQPSATRADSLWLQLDANFNPINLNRYVSGTGWTAMSNKVLSSTSFPTITGSSPSDRAYAAGLLVYRPDLNSLFTYDNINNRWIPTAGFHIFTTINSSTTIDATGPLINNLLCTGGSYTITLPSATINAGRQLTITAVSGTSAAAPITVTGNQNGSTGVSVLISRVGSTINYLSDGTTWWRSSYYNGAVNISATYTVDGAGQSPVDKIIASGQNYNITLPSPTTQAGRELVIVVTTATAGNPVSILGHLRGTAGATLAIAASNVMVRLICDGTTWQYCYFTSTT